MYIAAKCLKRLDFLWLQIVGSPLWPDFSISDLHCIVQWPDSFMQVKRTGVMGDIIQGMIKSTRSSWYRENHAQVPARHTTIHSMWRCDILQLVMCAVSAHEKGRRAFLLNQGIRRQFLDMRYLTNANANVGHWDIQQRGSTESSNIVGEHFRVQ